VSERPVVVLMPSPQRSDRILSVERRAELEQLCTLVDLEFAPAEALDEVLPEAYAVIGQPDLDADRLARATELRAIFNVEGNFYPNIDYPAAFDRGIYVLGCGPAYAQAVAEHVLGLALDLARGISHQDRAFRTGTERYVADGNDDAILLAGSRIGLVGFGNLGRALLPLLNPFGATIRVVDPWLPDRVLTEQGMIASSLDEVCTNSQILFVLATATPDSEHLLGARELDLLPDKARFVLVSRAAVVDLDALLDRVEAGRILAAVDVWPSEPVPADHRARGLEGLVFSGHRAGGIPAAFARIGDLVVDDLRQLLNGLPPVRMQIAARELVGRYRNRPVT